jgi:thermostable 8-oxoguanine DNA glycosylase
MYAMVCNFRNFRNVCTFEETFDELSYCMLNKVKISSKAYIRNIK